jgi:type VI secretion system protein ImpL
MDKALLPYLVVLLVTAVVLVIVTAVLIFFSRRQDAAKPHKAAVNQRQSESFLTSLASLRSKIPDGDFLYRVPWILALGEPGAGRTSLLRQMDAESSGHQSDVEWFFLQGGALLDVPGDFLLSAEGAAVDDGRWKKLLRLLVRYRPHRPVDGVVLTIPASSLMSFGAVADAQRSSRAAGLRNQLDQLQSELGMVVPVHVLVTKCDKLRGFRDFSEQLDPTSGDQLFGWSNASTLETAFSPERIDEAFDILASRLLELELGMFSRDLHAAVDDLFLFPAELERLRSPLKNYLNRVFQETSYVEPNFLRGIYFCGDVLLQPRAIHPLDALLDAEETALTVQSSAESALARLDRHQPEVTFIRHFFQLKVFPEAKIARATRGIRLSRDRGLLITQTALAAFLIVFSVGTAIAYSRLSSFSSHRVKPVLDILASRLPENPEDQRSLSVSSAYDLVDLLGVVDVHGFRAFFLPASWGDPINSAVGKTLADGFSKRVLIAFKNELSRRVKAQEGACRPIPPIAQKLPTDVDALAQLNFTNDLEYQALDRSLNDIDRLRKAVNTYNDLRLAGRGSFQELDELFRYLISKDLGDESRFRQNPYYLRAMEEQSAGPVEMKDTLDPKRNFEACMALQTQSRLDNFFASWFGANNPLPLLTNGVADEVDGLNSGSSRTNEKLRFLVDDVRRLDALVSSGEYRWLREPSFNPIDFPVLAKEVSSEPFADDAFMQRMNDNGSHAFSKLKDDLFSVRTAPTGYVLEDLQGEIRIDPEVNTAAANLDVLLTQDFMAEAAASALLNPAQGVIWHKAALQRPLQLMDSYDKYLKDNLPLFPAGLRISISNIAQEGLRSSVLSAIGRAQEPVNPMSASDPATLMLEIRSLDESLPQLSQIAAAIAPNATASNSELDRIVYNQAEALSQKLTTLFKTQGFFAPGSVTITSWDGIHPLSLLLFGMDTPEDLDVYLAKQQDQLKSFALNYAQPLQDYLESHRLQDVHGPDAWTGIIRDVKDFDANKPANPLAAMSAFIRSQLDRINLAGACQAAVVAPPSSDYFLVIRDKLQRAAVARCGGILLDHYNTRVAQFFNQKLAGKFPFGPVPSSVESTEADPADTLSFFAALNEVGTPVMKYIQTSNRNPQIYAFLKQSDQVRQFFAPGLADDAILVDSKVFFRVNRSAEEKGDEIIDWRLQAGDAAVRMGDPANGLRWTYGAPIVISMRFAKDSPDVPVPGAKTTDAVIEGRNVRYEFRDPWSLFRLISAHNSLADFGVPASGPSGMLTFVIPTLAEQRQKSPGAIQNQDEAKVFARLVFVIQNGKEQREMTLPPFPDFAPTTHSAAALPSPN